MAPGCRQMLSHIGLPRRQSWSEKSNPTSPRVTYFYLRRVEMRHAYLFISAIAILACAGAANAQLIYSFETGVPAFPDGFGPNGGGATVAQDTIGATDSTHSLKYSVTTGA